MAAKATAQPAKGLTVSRALGLSDALVKIFFTANAWRPGDNLTAPKKTALLEALANTEETYPADPSTLKAWLGKAYLLGEAALYVLDKHLQTGGELDPAVRLSKIVELDAEVENALFALNLQLQIMGPIFTAPELASASSKPQYKDIVSTLLSNCISLVVPISHDDEVASPVSSAPTTYPAPVRGPTPSAAPLGVLPQPGPALAAAGFHNDEQAQAVATGTFNDGDLQALGAFQGPRKPPPKPRSAAPPATPLASPLSIETMERAAEDARQQVPLAISLRHILFRTFLLLPLFFPLFSATSGGRRSGTNHCAWRRLGASRRPMRDARSSALTANALSSVRTPSVSARPPSAKPKSCATSGATRPKSCATNGGRRPSASARRPNTRKTRSCWARF